MAEKSVMDLLQEKSLTIRDHLDPDKHWIGEALAVPSQTEISATVGVVSTPGESPYVARADHQHKLDPGIFPTTDIYTPPGIDNATTGSTFAPWITMPGVLSIPSWATLAMIQMNINNVTCITAACSYAITFTVGATVATGDYGIIVFDAVGENKNSTFCRTVALTGTGTQNIVIYARRLSGTGQMQAVTGTRFTTMTFFKP